MSISTESMSMANLNETPTFGGEVLDVAMNGVVYAGVGYLCAKIFKTNVVTSAIIWGCQGLTEATFGKIIKHSLGEETRNAKIILAVGNCLIGTIVTIASVAFGILSMSNGVLGAVFVFGSSGWELFKVFKPEQAKMCTDYIQEQIRNLLPQPRPKETQIDAPEQEQQAASSEQEQQVASSEQEQQVASSEQDESIDLFEQAAAVEVKPLKDNQEFVEIDLNANSKEKVQKPLSRVLSQRFEEIPHPKTTNLDQLVTVECN